MSITSKCLRPGVAAAAALAASDGRILRRRRRRTPANDVPNPYSTIKDHFKLPAGAPGARRAPSTSTRTADRSGSPSAAARTPASTATTGRRSRRRRSILKFDTNGKLVESFGAGLLIFPHGIHVDRDGNVWVTDGQDNAPRPARGAPARARWWRRRLRRCGGSAAALRPGRWRAARRSVAAPACPAPRAESGGDQGPSGVQVQPRRQGADDARQAGRRQRSRVLLPAERRHHQRRTARSSSPKATASSPATIGRILKFDRTGKLIKTWGKCGTGAGEFDQPHALAFDSQGRLFVGDRGNNRVQIFDQDGQVHRQVAAVQPAERHLHRQERHPLRRRLRIRRQ